VTDSPWEGLLGAARAGAEWAWSDLYRSLAPKVRGYAVAQGVSDPDGVVGDVFLQVARNLASFNGDEAGFRSWVFTIAFRRIVDERRRTGRRLEDPTDRIPDSGTDAPAAEDVALGRMASESMTQALALLTTEQRQVLGLRILADLSVDEVAVIIGKRPGAVKALQRRAIATLRRNLDEAVS